MDALMRTAVVGGASQRPEVSHARRRSSIPKEGLDGAVASKLLQSIANQRHRLFNVTRIQFPGSARALACSGSRLADRIRNVRQFTCPGTGCETEFLAAAM